MGCFSTKSQKITPEIILANALIFVKRYYTKFRYFLKETFISAFGYFRSALRTVTFSDVDQSFQEKEALNSATNSTVTSTTEYYSAISSDDEFFDLPSDTEEDGYDTPTNETINQQPNNGGGTNGLVQQALERLESEYVIDPERKELVHFFRTIGKRIDSGGTDTRSTRILCTRSAWVLGTRS